MGKRWPGKCICNSKQLLAVNSLRLQRPLGQPSPSRANAVRIASRAFAAIVRPNAHMRMSGSWFRYGNLVAPLVHARTHPHDRVRARQSLPLFPGNKNVDVERQIRLKLKISPKRMHLAAARQHLLALQRLLPLASESRSQGQRQGRAGNSLSTLPDSKGWMPTNSTLCRLITG